MHEEFAIPPDEFLTPGEDPGGIWIATGLGVAGAFVADFLRRALSSYGEGHNAGILGSTIGAKLLLLMYRMLKGKYARPAA